MISTLDNARITQSDCALSKTSPTILIPISHRAQRDEEFKEIAQSSQKLKLCARFSKKSWSPAQEDQPRGAGMLIVSQDGTYWLRTQVIVKNFKSDTQRNIVLSITVNSVCDWEIWVVMCMNNCEFSWIKIVT